MKKRLLASAVLLASGSLAVAATETSTFQVTAEVVASCDVTASTLAFGQYDPLVAGAHTGNSTITVKCSNGASYDVGLNDGGNAEAGQRRMSDGAATAAFLSYNLFQDSGRTTSWGEVVGTDTLSATGTGANQEHQVYASIPEQSDASVGNYTDTVTVTVTY